MRTLVLLALLGQALFAQLEVEVRNGVARALPSLQSSAAQFVAKRACVSCHHNTLPVLTFHLALNRGFKIDPAVLNAVEDKSFHDLRNPAAFDQAVQASTLNDPTPDDSFLLITAHDAAIGADPLTLAVYAHRLVHWERDGHWVTSDFRPPHSRSLFTATASAVRSIRLYLPEELQAEGDACLQRARKWLSATKPASTEDASYRLMGLVWVGALPTEIESARRDLLALQMPDGGWSQLPHYQADAYSTGESIYALRESGVQATDSALRKGLQYLLSTENADGTWKVRSRMISPASVSPEYFTTGFPYVKNEYISYAGSCWAVMAFLSTIPESASKPPAPKSVPSGAEPAPAWARTALFGTPRQLTDLLDAGLDPNSKTANGTTLLMMAATDPEKVRLLLARGGDAKARASSGYDAVNIAAAYRGTAASLQLLLDAGAEFKPPKGIRIHLPPMVLAAMTGDVDNVKVLLAHGADPATGLGQAVTFGYVDVVRTLIAAGASATVKESTGINLLHWAAITGHPEVIPVLAEAGARVNAIDDNGFTPLMYAATIDFGNSEILKALLKAGADPNLKNEDGRTAREQAAHFGLTDLAASLK